MKTARTLLFTVIMMAVQPVHTEASGGHHDAESPEALAAEAHEVAPGAGAHGGGSGEKPLPAAHALPADVKHAANDAHAVLAEGAGSPGKLPILESRIRGAALPAVLRAAVAAAAHRHPEHAVGGACRLAVLARCLRLRAAGPWEADDESRAVWRHPAALTRGHDGLHEHGAVPLVRMGSRSDGGGNQIGRAHV